MKNAPEIRAAKDVAKNPYAWPGGYPKFLVMCDGSALCHSCVKENFALIGRSTRDGNASDWAAAGAEINWENASLYCDHCGNQIPSAYGDDE